MNTKELTIKPVGGGMFSMRSPGNLPIICEDADAVGESIEGVLWPIIKPALKENKPITITITEK